MKEHLLRPPAERGCLAEGASPSSQGAEILALYKPEPDGDCEEKRFYGKSHCAPLVGQGVRAHGHVVRLSCQLSSSDTRSWVADRRSKNHRAKGTSRIIEKYALELFRPFEVSNIFSGEKDNEDATNPLSRPYQGLYTIIRTFRG